MIIMDPLTTNRRCFLGLAGAVGAAIFQRGASDRATSHTGDDRIPGLLPLNPFRPLSISDPRDLPHLPGDARLVPWRWARSRAVSLQDAISTLDVNDILVLPEDEKPFEIDTSQGFRVAAGSNYYSMCASARGIVGRGPGAVIQPSSSAFRSRPQAYSGGLQEKMIESREPNAYFGNFTMRGRDLGGVAYNAIWASGPGTTWERIYFRGAQRGFLSYPPGEAGAICGYRGSNMRAFNCEIDCRDELGNSVGTSPLMWNVQKNVLMREIYAHHTYTGMPTFWRVHGAVATNLIHSHLDVGLPRSPGVNVEQCSGTFKFDDCVFIVGYGAKNQGLHLNTGGQTASVRFEIRNPTIDAGRWPGLFSIQEFGTTNQRESDYIITRADGSPYPHRVAH